MSPKPGRLKDTQKLCETAAKDFQLWLGQDGGGFKNASLVWSIVIPLVVPMCNIRVILGLYRDNGEEIKG